MTIRYHDSVGTFYESCSICGKPMTIKEKNKALCADCWEKKRKQYERPNVWKYKKKLTQGVTTT